MSAEMRVPLIDQVPVLYLVGKKDTVISPEHTEELFDKTKGCSFK